MQGVTDRLAAQLKVNLRPLWVPAASALSTLATRFGDLVWGLLFEEVKNASTGSLSATSDPAWSKEAVDDGDDVWEEERSWRDPSAHKLRTTLAKWSGHKAAQLAIVQVRSVISGTVVSMLIVCRVKPVGIDST